MWAEHEQVEAATEKLQRLTAATHRDYDRAAFIVDNDLDDEGIGTFLYHETYFGVDKDRHHAAADLSELKALRDTRTQSRAAVAGSLLQIAKQVLSQFHGGFGSIPTGRPVLGVDLKDVIWQGRNQSLHWEEGNPRQPIIDCFSTLAVSDAAFATFANDNLAFEIVSALDWRDWGRMENDLLSLT